MRKKNLLLLLLPFVTFSQSVFSPKSNPNSLGIAKSFGDNNFIDKPINLPFEKLHFVDVVSINKAVAELLIIKFIEYAQDGDFLKIISELNYYTSEEEKTQAIKNFSVMEKKKQFYLVEYYKAKYKDAAVIKSDKVSDSIICVFVESYDYTGEKITSKEEPIFVINIDGNWYRYIYTPTKKNNANSLGIAKSFSDNKTKNKTLPINIEINRDFEENLIKKEEVKINIPVNWEVLAESDKNLLLNSLFENSQYKGNIDYLLTLSNSEINSYPSISVLIQKDYEITKLGINEFADMFINTLNNSTLTILDGMKGVITDHNDLGNYIDKKNQILYIINEGTVANVGQIKTIAAILFKKDYIISLTLNTYPEDFERFKSALQIMANSTRL